MIPIATAIRMVMDACPSLPTERVALGQSLGLFLAEPLIAREDAPPYDNSAMDGYAVRSEDVGAPPLSLPVRGESRAGGRWPDPLAPGVAMRIFTGAPLPEGADIVVVQENARATDGSVELLEVGPPGANIRRRGEVLTAGSPLLEAATRLGSGEIALLASQGHAVIPVHRRPRVAILPTGDELRELGAPPAAGTLIDSNSHGLVAAVREAGGVPLLLPRAADQPGALQAATAAGLAASDVLITTGGVSVGEYDLVHGAFAAVGVEERFWKVAIKPGKPVRFGTLGERLVFGLPGNPVSALVTFEVFVRPALRRLLGDPSPYRPTVEVSLAWRARAPKGRSELARVRVDADGRATPTAAQGSAFTTSMVQVEALAILARGAGELDVGTSVTALDLRGGTGSSIPPFR